MTTKKTGLSDVALRKAKPTGERHEISDDIVVGLRARISATGEVTFILKARDNANKLKTITLGSYPETSLKIARELASKARLDLKAGRDINDEKRRIRQAAANPASTLSLKELVLEFQTRFSPSKSTWAPRGPKSTRSGALQVIERVYANLLDKDVTKISDAEFAQAALSYRRVRPDNGRTTANGQASRARSYLGPVLDWAAGRKAFSKIGASRSPQLTVVSLATTHDPATDDPTITGKRDRVLSEAELKAILPLLRYPAPPIGKLSLKPDLDYRAIAVRFMLFTAARLEEVCAMKWRDFDRSNGVWHKPRVKSTRGGPRKQDLPLSQAACSILRSLPRWNTAQPSELVFPNATGDGKLGNWARYQEALHEASGTANWHRHDLRRTAATIMFALKIPASTITRILAHADPLKGENVGGAASNYLQLTKILQNTRDTQEEALSILAEALQTIENAVTAS